MAHRLKLTPRRWVPGLLTLVALSSRLALAAPSFDCKLAHSPVEQLICSDDTLARLDRDQVATYERLRRAASPTGAALLLKQQHTWLASRAGCLKESYAGDRNRQIECLTNAYQDSGGLETHFRQSGGLMLEYRESVRHIPRLRVTETESHPWLTGQPASRAAAFNQYVTTRLSLVKGMFAAAPIKIDRPPEGDTEYERFHEIHHMDGKLISIEVYRHHISYVGHGWRMEFALNWDLRKSRPIKLAELFQPNTDWQKAVMDQVRTWVHQDGNADDPGDIINQAEPEDDEGWVFDDDTAVLLVGRGERSMVGSAADVPIPYDVLAPFLLPDSPLPVHGNR